MKGGFLMIPLLIGGIVLATGSCGKKGPPFLSRDKFSARVEGLEGKWAGGNILLKGTVEGEGGTKRAKGLVDGARVYYRRYSLERAPCDSCPIEYQDYHAFGGEVLTEEGFHCVLPGMTGGQIYFFKVYLVGPKGVLGPPSNQVKVVVK